MTVKKAPALDAWGLPKPLLRGWFHAAATLGAVALTIGLCLRTWTDPPRLISMLIFGLSLIELYTLSAVYHIGRWSARTRRVLRSIDHANIFVLIAGTYTPVCFNVFNGPLRTAMLALIWTLAAAGIAIAVFFLHAPRWLTAAFYLGMGWVAVFVLPTLTNLLGWLPVALSLLGGLLYTIGALIYARRWPNPFPRVFGFHEIFHLFVIAGGLAEAAMIWVWVVPYPRG